MPSSRRFLIGGIGAMMPVLITIVTLDLAVALGKDGALSTLNILGIIIRYIALFLIGGFVAYLHDGENSPVKIFEIGVAAPALITSLVVANAAAPAKAPSPGPSSLMILTIARAEAGELVAQRSQGISEVLQGITGSVYGTRERVAAPVTPAPNVAWVAATGGALPAGAIQAGQEHPPGREPLYVCRAAFRGGVHPGKVRPAFGGCNIGWGGQEYTVASYEALVGNAAWQRASGGAVPNGAVRAGQEHVPGREDLFVCRAQLNGGTHPGKVRAGFNGCNVGWGGTEHVVASYEVLVR